MACGGNVWLLLVEVQSYFRIFQSLMHMSQSDAVQEEIGLLLAEAVVCYRSSQPTMAEAELTIVR
jgi:hypothetical protein